MNIYDRLNELNIKLPQPPEQKGIYKAVNQSGKLLWTSGTGPVADGKLIYSGKIGANLTITEGQECAKIATLNILSAVNKYLGDLNRIKKVVKLLVFVASANDFNRQPEVANTASQLLIDIFGEEGLASRSAVGVNVLPLDFPVEIEAIFELAN